MEKIQIRRKQLTVVTDSLEITDSSCLVKHVQTLVILQFEVDVVARNQHIDDVVVVT